MDPALIGTAATISGLCLGGCWAVWVRVVDKIEKLREHVDAQDARLRAELAAGLKSDAARDQIVAVLQEAQSRSEGEVAKNLERIYERLDQLASKVEAHMAGEAGEVERMLRQVIRQELTSRSS